MRVSVGLVGRLGTLAALAAIVALLPATLSNFHTYQFAFVGIYFIAIVGLNILTGYSGQISLGQGAFMAIGAYTTTILSVDHGVGIYWTIPCAGVLAGADRVRLRLPRAAAHGRVPRARDLRARDRDPA